MRLIAAPRTAVTDDARSHEQPSACNRLTSPIIKKIGGWTARARQRQALADLDDRLLGDIGITRRAAEKELERPFWQ